MTLFGPFFSHDLLLSQCREELARLEKLKLEHNKKQIMKVQVDISIYWDKLHLVGSERRPPPTGTYFFVDLLILKDIFDDAALLSAQDYLSSLRKQYELAEPLFKLIGQHEKVLQQCFRFI